MSDPFTGQITQIAFNFAPQDYAHCDGQELEIEQNMSLYALLRTTFGGDGAKTFNLPDLRGRVPVHPDERTDIYEQGVKQGSEQVTLTTSQLPVHTHNFVATTLDGDAPFPNPTATKIFAKAVLAQSLEPKSIDGAPTDLLQLNPNTMTSTGSGQPHFNLQPSLVIGFIIALCGAFPVHN